MLMLQQRTFDLQKIIFVEFLMQEGQPNGFYEQDSFFNANESEKQFHPDTLENTPREELNVSNCKLQVWQFHHSFQEQLSHELIEGLNLADITKIGSVGLGELLKKIQNQANYCFQNCQIYVYSSEHQVFINCGVYPLTSATLLELKEILETTTQTIQLKSKRISWGLAHMELFKNTSNFLLEGPPKKFSDATHLPLEVQRKSSIKNFQKVGYIVKKVLFLKQKRRKTKFQGEQQVFKNDREFTKKSIEDYYYQIRLGFKNGYNFNEHCRENMKHLRDHNRSMQEKQQKPQEARIGTFPEE